MTTPLIIAVVAIAILIAGMAAGVIVRTAQRRNKLRGQFGPEYDHTLESGGSRRQAERELLHRQTRVERMNIHPLNPAARDAYHAEWTGVQERFVDTPQDALSDADQIVRRVMADRGYETKAFQQRVADLSVEHASTLEHYRTAHEISARASNKETSTEELRQAMVHYRTLFQDLLGTGTGDPAQAIPQTQRDPRQRTVNEYGARGKS